MRLHLRHGRGLSSGLFRPQALPWIFVLLLSGLPGVAPLAAGVETRPEFVHPWFEPTAGAWVFGGQDEDAPPDAAERREPSATEALREPEPAVPETGEWAAPEMVAEREFAPEPTELPRSGRRESGLIRRPDPEIKLPWWRNGWPFLAVSGLLGFSGLAGAAAIRRRQARGRRLGQAELRARGLRQRQRALLRALERATDAELPERLREQGVPLIREWLDLPPGTTADELAEQLRSRDPELSAMLAALDHIEYRPELMDVFSRSRLLAACRRLLLACLVGGFWGILLNCAAAAGQAESRLGDERGRVFAAAVAAFDRGAYEEAERGFAELSRGDVANAALLHNRGVCKWRLGEPYRALALHERARRVAPRDPRLRQRLGSVRSELGLPSRFEPTAWLAGVCELRDWLRPDQWLRLLFGAFAICGVVAFGLAVTGRSGVRRCLAVFAVVAGLLLAAVWSQATGSYQVGGRGVVAGEAVLYSAPSQTAARMDLVDPVSREVAVVERHLDWLRVRNRSVEGWLPASDLEHYW